MTTNFVTPVGRFVQGDAFRSNDKDYEGKPLTTKTGAPRVEWFVAIACKKSDPATAVLIQTIFKAAKDAWPELFAQGEPSHDDFSWKYVDGDKQPEREGFAGCYVFKFSNGFEPKVVGAGGAPRLTDPEELKRGHFIRILGSCKGNGSKGNPGVFLNMHAIERVAYGEEINVGPDLQKAFGDSPGQLPDGASTTPVAASDASYLQGEGGNTAPAPGGAPPPPAPAARQLPASVIIDGVNYTVDQLRAQGWTDAQIIGHPGAVPF